MSGRGTTKSRADARGPWWLQAGGALGRRPGLWATGLAQVRTLAAPGWWRRWPPVPAPDPAWLRFRLTTAYGDAGADPEPDDVIAWLAWCKGLRRPARRGPIRR